MAPPPCTTPRCILAGLSGGAGKTIVSLGLARALTHAGLAVKPFKKGPDYIDAAWLSLAAGSEATNLDPFLLSAETLRALFADRLEGHQFGLIEGNRGLFDGKDVAGSASTAELARILAAPTVLVLDATKMTRTAAAIVAGLNHFEPGFRLAGVIGNRCAGARHRAILRQTIETYTDTPVLGLLPKLAANPIPERHMGLMSSQEMAGLEPILDQLGQVLADHVDLTRFQSLAAAAAPLDIPAVDLWPAPVTAEPVTIGVVRDAALWFYYPENLEALRRAGAQLVFVSLLDNAPWPELHGLYLGGGFPETQAPQLATASATRQRVLHLANAGLPIYAECGGFMVLCEALEIDGQRYPMAGVFPVATRLCARPQGLGYVEAQVVAESPFHTPGQVLRGHEFHYSVCLATPDQPLTFALHMQRGNGMVGQRDGLLHHNTFASYTHLHALGHPHWAPRFVAAAAAWRAHGKSPPPDTTGG